MSLFLTHVQLEPMWDAVGMPLFNRDGRRLLETISSLRYRSDIGGLIEVVSKFVTDLGSVPRIPLIYDMLGDIAIEPFILHDWLYSTGAMPRLLADQVLREALLLVGIAKWKVEMIYWGVRVGGGKHYASNYSV